MHVLKQVAQQTKEIVPSFISMPDGFALFFFFPFLFLLFFLVIFFPNARLSEFGRDPWY
jgi:hypothetical protein